MTGGAEVLIDLATRGESCLFRSARAARRSERPPRLCPASRRARVPPRARAASGSRLIRRDRRQRRFPRERERRAGARRVRVPAGPPRPCASVSSPSAGDRAKAAAPPGSASCAGTRRARFVTAREPRAAPAIRAAVARAARSPRHEGAPSAARPCASPRRSNRATRQSPAPCAADTIVAASMLMAAVRSARLVASAAAAARERALRSRSAR